MTERRDRLDIDAIRDAYSGDGLVDLIAGRKGPGGLPSVKLTRKGNRHWGLCPFHAETTPSFIVDSRGFHCFGCGAHGTAFDYVIQALGGTFIEAARLLAGEVRQAPEDAGARAEQRDRERAAHAERERRRHWARRDIALQVWAAATDDNAQRHIVRRYLAARGLAGLDLPPTLRVIQRRDLRRVIPWSTGHAVVGHYPAMVAPFAVEGRITGVHLTFLAPDGSGKADASPNKMILGHYSGAAIPLSPIRHTMALGEGIETCLSAALARPDWGIWCAGSLNNLAGPGQGRGTPHPDRPGVTVPSPEPDMAAPAITLPATTDRLVVLGDGDSDPAVATAFAERARRRYARAGLRVAVAFPTAAGMDFNDRLQAGSAPPAEAAAIDGAA